MPAIAFRADRRPDTERSRPAQAASRLRPDRGAGDEAGHDRGSDLHLEALGDHPLAVTSGQDFIVAAQFRTGEQMIKLQNQRRPGTILAFLGPLCKDGLEGVTPGSSCIVK